MNMHNIRSWFYLRFVYPMEVRLRRRYGKRQECGCETLWGSKRIYCWTHAQEFWDQDLH